MLMNHAGARAVQLGAAQHALDSQVPAWHTERAALEARLQVLQAEEQAARCVCGGGGHHIGRERRPAHPCTMAQRHTPHAQISSIRGPGQSWWSLIRCFRVLTPRLVACGCRSRLPACLCTETRWLRLRRLWRSCRRRWMPTDVSRSSRCKDEPKDTARSALICWQQVGAWRAARLHRSARHGLPICISWQA